MDTVNNDRSQSIFSLNKSDVISFQDATIKVEHFDSKVISIAESQDIMNVFSHNIRNWRRFAQASASNRSFNWLEGVPCEVLKVGNSQWQQGKLKLKVRFELEFEPDTPLEMATSAQPATGESPLDEIRKMTNQ